MVGYLVFSGSALVLVGGYGSFCMIGASLLL